MKWASVKRGTQIWLSTKKRIMAFRPSGMKGDRCFNLVMTMYSTRSGEKNNQEVEQSGPPLRYQEDAELLKEEDRFGEPRSSGSRQKRSASCSEAISDHSESATKVPITRDVQGSTIALDRGEKGVPVNGLPPVQSLDSPYYSPSV